MAADHDFWDDPDLWSATHFDSLPSITQNIDDYQEPNMFNSLLFEQSQPPVFQTAPQATSPSPKKSQSNSPTQVVFVDATSSPDAQRRKVRSFAMRQARKKRFWSTKPLKDRSSTDPEGDESHASPPNEDIGSGPSEPTVSQSRRKTASRSTTGRKRKPELPEEALELPLPTLPAVQPNKSVDPLHGLSPDMDSRTATLMRHCK